MDFKSRNLSWVVLLCFLTVGSQVFGGVKLEAEDFDEQSGVQTEVCSEGGQNVGYIEDNDYIKFSSVAIGDGEETMTFRIASDSNGGTINLYLDAKKGTPHVSIAVPSTGGWQAWQSISETIPKVEGVHDVYLEFKGQGGYLFNIDWFSFGTPPLANAIELIFPYDNETLSDFACSWKAKITTEGPYELQLSRDTSFSDYITRKPQASKYNADEVKDDKGIVYFLSSQGTLIPNDRWILDTGTWYWRITADNGKSVSNTRKLTVTNDETATSIERKISPKHPLFHLRLRRPTTNPASDIAKIIPDEFKDDIVLNIGLLYDFLHNGELDLYKYAKKFNDTGYKFAIDFGYPSNIDIRVSLGEIEKIYRDLPNFVGGEMTEMFYNNRETDVDNSHIHGALKLSRKYGKYMFHADMNWKYNKWLPFNYEMYDIIKEKYADYYIPALKATEPFGTYTVISTLQGMKLSGMARNIGMWSDMWSWEKFGDVNTFGIDNFLSSTHGTGQEGVFPYIQHMKQYIYAITYGATVFGLEPAKQWDWGVTPNDLYYRYLMPFIDAVITENIIPSEKAINDNFNVVVDTEIKTEDPKQTPVITYMQGNVWGDFLRNTFGIADIPGYDAEKNALGTTIKRSAYIEISPNTDRYLSGIPFLAKSGIAAPVVNGRTLEVVKISDMTDPQNVEQKINKYYPESTNQAFATKIDSSVFVFNTVENHDINQSYNLALEFAGIDKMYGNIHLMSYVMGRLRADGKTLFIQANAYKQGGNGNENDYDYGRYNLPTYPTIINFKCQQQPILESETLHAINKSWDSEKGILRVEINHELVGAVNFTLRGNKLISYHPDSLVLHRKNIELHVTDTLTLKPQLYPSTIKGVSIAWKSLDKTIATVNEKGLVTAINSGNTNVVVYHNSSHVSDTCSIVVKQMPSLINNSTLNKVSIFPNPANNKFTVSSASEGMRHIVIHDNLGKAIVRYNVEGQNTSEIDVSSIKPGTYYIQIELSNHAKICGVLLIN